MKIILPQKPWCHDYGDFVYGNSEYISNVTLNEIDDKEILYLSFIECNGWKALSNVFALANGFSLGYYTLRKITDKFTYECNYTDKEYIAVLPIAIITDDVKKYFQSVVPWLQESISDQEWIKSFYPLKEIPGEQLDSISRCILGTGYAKCFDINDGSFSYEYSKMELDNGDYVLCVNLVWHNK